MRKVLYYAVLAVCSVAAAQTRDVQPGQVVREMHVPAKPDQSYALYLPSKYTRTASWPIVYVFDPGARGSVPLELMKEAAERDGFILAGSNNSRNGSWDSSFQAASAVWDDTHTWLSIDDRRVYFAGFSGGARVSAQLAQACHCAHGVFLNGAGFGVSSPPNSKTKFAVYSLAGMGDFNYGELLDLDMQVATLGYRHALLRFEGEHSWAPADAWQQAFSWAAVLEMKDGSRTRDDAFLRAELSQAMQRVRQREDAGQAMFALQEYRSLAAEYDGLADTSAANERIAALVNSPSARAQLRQEQAELDRQRKLTADFFEAADRLKTRRDDERDLRTQAMSIVTGMQRALSKEKSPEWRRTYQRSLGAVFIAMMESSNPLMDAGEYRSAEFYLQLAAVARPDWAWPHLRLAVCHAFMANKKEALQALAKAHQLGASADEIAKVVQSNPKLAAMVDENELQKIAGTPAEK